MTKEEIIEIAKQCESNDYNGQWSFDIISFARLIAKRQREESCDWLEDYDGGPWATQCNELFNIENEGPEANGMKFCCFCGKKLVEVHAESEEEDV